MARRQPDLVQPAHVLRIGDRNPQTRPVERKRNRAHMLQHMQRHRLARVGVDVRDRQVDEIHVVPLGERPRCAQRARGAIVAEHRRRRHRQ